MKRGITREQIFKAQKEIEENINLGYKVISRFIHNKDIINIVCNKLKINFYIDDIASNDLYNIYLRSGYEKYIIFEDWLLKKELIE